MAMREHPLYRYEDLAGFITGLVDNGTLALGSRAPSLRQICQQQRTSLSTALQAYRLLEDRGVLEARPQSGFYVARRSEVPLETPALSNPPARPSSVAVSSVVMILLDYASDTRLVPLGCAIPSPEILAAGRLDRFLARAARARGAESNVYSNPQGDLHLRQEIARRALQWGQALSPADVAITYGCTESLTLALKSVSRPGDTIAVESPTFFGFLLIIEALNLKVLELPTDARNGVDIGALRKALGRERIAACLFSSSFNNPLGCTVPEEKKVAILGLLARHKVPLIEDDIYGDIYFGPSRPRPFMALDPGGNTIYCSSFSKTVAPGYRIGWIAAGRHMKRVVEQKFALTLCGPPLLQAAMADFLASGGYENHLRRMRRTFEGNIDQMLRTIARAFPKGTSVSRPAGGFVLWLELPGRINSRELFAQSLAKGVCFVPGDAFSTSNRYTSFLRLSCGYPWNVRIEQGVELIGAIACAALPRASKGKGRRQAAG
jgi:DNA-binding transcriptional MocR family regulator